MKSKDAEIFEIVVLNHVGFEGKWAGWRMAGEFLISPDDLRLRCPQMRALFWEYGQKKRAKKEKVIKAKTGNDERQRELF